MAIWSPLAKALGVPTEDSVGFSYDGAQRVLPPPHEPYLGYWSVADPGIALETMVNQKAVIDHFWRTQPQVRKVVDFIARAVSTIPLHTFERVSDTDRARVTDHPIAALLSEPRPGVTPYRFWRGVISDGLLYDRWGVLYAETPAGPTMTHIPSWRLHLITNALNIVTGARYWEGTSRPDTKSKEGWVELPLEDLIFSHGYSPSGSGFSSIETLKDILLESQESVKYRRQTWRNSARTPAWIERPAPVAGQGAGWSETAKRRFLAGFRAAFSGDGENAGGTPLLEDGMKLHSLSAFSPVDVQDLEGRRLTAIEVAAAYHIAPELVGAREGTYSNVREYRQSLYKDNLGPYVVDWEQAVHGFLTRRLAGGRALYVEANLESKLRGSFEEQAALLATSTGAPWMLRSEARAVMNLPFEPGTDEMVVPLNVLIGDQANPRDSGTQNEDPAAAEPKARKSVRVKGRAPETYETKSRKVLSDFFKRQRKAVLSALGAKAGESWWDERRWNEELSDDLMRLGELVSVQVAATTLAELGYSPDDYDTGRTLAFLRSVADRLATSINASTLSALQATLAETTETERAEGLAHVFDVAESSRSEQLAGAVLTTYSGFATTEAARQVSGDAATKTWKTTSPNPRASHKKMDGETVPIGEKFSNGAEWPGDALALDVDDVAGCKCDVTIRLGG